MRLPQVCLQAMDCPCKSQKRLQYSLSVRKMRPNLHNALKNQSCFHHSGDMTDLFIKGVSVGKCARKLYRDRCRRSPVHSRILVKTHNVSPAAVETGKNRRQHPGSVLQHGMEGNYPVLHFLLIGKNAVTVFVICAAGNFRPFAGRGGAFFLPRGKQPLDLHYFKENLRQHLAAYHRIFSPSAVYFHSINSENYSPPRKYKCIYHKYNCTIFFTLCQGFLGKFMSK